jgi:nucleoside-diphosphate-sugar epimerase
MNIKRFVKSFLPKRIFSSARLIAGMAQARRIRAQHYNAAAKVKVFVTGDVGKLGSRIAEYLKGDYQIIGFDIRCSLRESLANYRLLKKRMKGCTYVVHCAAIPHPNQGSIKNYFDVNVAGSFNVMRAAEANKIKRFVYFSSGAYYGWDITEGRLLPAYFPIDENHPIASTKGRSEGKLVAYDQSKVMAEQLLAFYGTNRLFEAIALRIAPANSKASQYPSNNHWKTDPGFQRRGLWTNFDPELVGHVVKRALEAPGEFWYEPFNICDKYTHREVNVKEFLQKEYPGVPIRCDLSDNPALLSVERAERILGVKLCTNTE